MFWPEFSRAGLSGTAWREMDRLFSGISLPYERSFPAVNIWEGEEAVVLTAEIPGIDPDKIDISVHGDTLTLTGSRSPEALKEGETCNRQERSHGRFTRTVELPFRVDEEAVDARYEKGVLSIKLPMHEEEKPKRIRIKSS